jgi:HEAT repeat protein
MSPNKLLSIWENYWGILTPEWTEAFLQDERVKLILDYSELLILQAIQQNRKLEDILATLERNSKQRVSKIESEEFQFSRTIVDSLVGLGTESEVTEIKEWLLEFTRAKLSQDEVVTWLNVKTDIETCKTKKRYGSEKDAILALIRLGKKNGEVLKQLPYKCNVCREYHNSHLLSRETIDSLQRKYS